MPLNNTGMKHLADLRNKLVYIQLRTGQTETTFATEGNSKCIKTTVRTPVFCVTSTLLSTIKHLLNRNNILICIIFGMFRFKPIPMINKYRSENFSILFQAFCSIHNLQAVQSHLKNQELFKITS